MGKEIVDGYFAVWDGRDDQNQEVPAGVYCIMVKAGNRCFTAKIIRAK
jgi:hypothetical protein